jgi:hypothetical protein
MPSRIRILDRWWSTHPPDSGNRRSLRFPNERSLNAIPNHSRSFVRSRIDSINLDQSFARPKKRTKIPEDLAKGIIENGKFEVKHQTIAIDIARPDVKSNGKKEEFDKHDELRMLEKWMKKRTRTAKDEIIIRTSQRPYHLASERLLSETQG